MEAYLDNAATTRAHPSVWEAMRPYAVEQYGNPSSHHRMGEGAAEAVLQARRELAAALNCHPSELVFTSGGTEADNLAIIGTALAYAGQKRHIVASAAEHKAVLRAAEMLKTQGFTVTVVPVDSECRVLPSAVEAALRPETLLVSVMAVNNEVGTIQPIAEISRILRARHILFHTDAVQALGKIPLDVTALGVDLLSVSAHKIHGPKGVGALYVRHGVELSPLFHGGSQENGLRAGTENVPGIAGFAEAVRILRQSGETEMKRVQALRHRFEQGLSRVCSATFINASQAPRAPHITSVCCPKIEANYLLRRLNQRGVFATSGSACASASLETSHVLTAMGLDESDALSTVRFSFSMLNTENDVEYALQTLSAIHQELIAPASVFASLPTAQSASLP